MFKVRINSKKIVTYVSEYTYNTSFLLPLSISVSAYNVISVTAQTSSNDMFFVPIPWSNGNWYAVSFSVTQTGITRYRGEVGTTMSLIVQAIARQD